MKLVKEKPKPVLNVRYLIPSVLMVGFVPLIMRMHYYTTHLTKYDWFYAAEGAIDIFLWGKQWAVIVLACVCVIVLLVRKYYYFEDLPLEKFMIPAGIYGIMVVVSAIFGKSPLLAFAGSLDMFESALALLSYLVIAYYTYVSVVSLKHLLWFLRWSEWFILVELVIATFQGFGLDFFMTPVGKRLIIPMEYWDRTDELVNTAGANEAYGTVFNVDYFSMYLGVLFPILLGLVFLETKLWRKFFNTGLCILSVFVATHGASAGFIGITGAFVIGIFVLCSYKKKSMVICCTVAALLFVAGVIGIVKVPAPKNRVNYAFRGDGLNAEDRVPVKSIVTGDDNVTYTMKDGSVYTISFTLDETGSVLTPEVRDEDGVLFTPVLDDEATQKYSFKETDQKNIYVCEGSYKGYPAIQVFISEVGMTYVRDFDGGYSYLNPMGRPVKLPLEVENAHLFPDGLFSGRGEIYNKCLPLLPRHMIIGAGANCLILEYPQWDYITNAYTYASNALLSKPHCHYLQVWIEEGFVGLVALLVFYFWYIFDSIRLYRKAFWLATPEGNAASDTGASARMLARLGFFVFLGILAYLIVVLVNDSTICTAPVFWTVLGAGWAVNTLVKKGVNTK